MNLRHSLIVWFLLWVGPVNNNVTTPDTRITVADTMLGHRRRLVTVVFQKCKATILLLDIIRRIVDNDVGDAICQSNNTVYISHCPPASAVAVAMSQSAQQSVQNHV